MPVILRHNMGSLRHVENVFAYDVDNDEALVMLRDDDGYQTLHEMRSSELEALDEKRQYMDVVKELKKRADFILNRET